jgi:hypothetical protein
VAYTLRYRSTRGEVWRWYWRAWRQPRGLWRVHVGASLVVGVCVLVLRGGIEARAAFPIAIAAAFLSVAWLPLVRLIAFKPQERLLHLDERGEAARASAGRQRQCTSSAKASSRKTPTAGARTTAINAIGSRSYQASAQTSPATTSLARSRLAPRVSRASLAGRTTS